MTSGGREFSELSEEGSRAFHRYRRGVAPSSSDKCTHADAHIHSMRAGAPAQEPDEDERSFLIHETLEEIQVGKGRNERHLRCKAPCLLNLNAHFRG